MVVDSGRFPPHRQQRTGPNASSPPVIALDALRPGGRIAGVLDATGDYPRCATLALVGQEPLIGSLAAQLMGAQGSVPFKKGAVCRIDVETFPPRGAGQLIWLLPPRVLRRPGA